MFSLTRPSDEQIRRFIASQAELQFTYPAVGATESTPPLADPGLPHPGLPLAGTGAQETGVPGAQFVVDHTRGQLGRGEGAFERAKAALRRWEQFQLGWGQPCWPTAPLEPGQSIAVLVHVLGVIWSLNACRIVYVVDETEPIARFGFAYGTLPDHAESGEERFLIEWQRESDEVWYDILAFSRPNHFLAKLARPYVRRKQKQFARDSVAAMQRAVASDKLTDTQPTPNR